MKLKERFIEGEDIKREWNDLGQKIRIDWQGTRIWITPRAEHKLDALSDEKYEDILNAIFLILQESPFAVAFIGINQGMLAIRLS